MRLKTNIDTENQVVIITEQKMLGRAKWVQEIDVLLTEGKYILAGPKINK